MEEVCVQVNQRLDVTGGTRDNVPMFLGIDGALFASIFSVIVLAELPDKTALATLMMATRGKPGAVFLGVAAAFTVQSLVAVSFGRLFGLLPPLWVHLLSAVLFLGFAIWMWKDIGKFDKEQKGPPPPERSFWQTAGSAFVVIFIAEWGDLTQLATATFQARFQSTITVFVASVLALWFVTLIEVTVGHNLKHLIKPKMLQIIATVVFAVTGLCFLIFA